MISGSRILFVIVRAHFVESRMKNFPPHPPVLLPLRFRGGGEGGDNSLCPLWRAEPVGSGATTPSVAGSNGCHPSLPRTVAPWPRTVDKVKFARSNVSFRFRPHEALASPVRNIPAVNSRPAGADRAKRWVQLPLNQT